MEFFYQPKTDIFAEDNAHEFPLPVRDNRADPSSAPAAKAIQYSEEPTIYIHQEKGTMCAALTGDYQGLSMAARAARKVGLNNPTLGEKVRPP